MKRFLSGSIWGRLLALVVLGISLFVLAILSKNIPERISRAQHAEAAIKQLDAARRPLLEIKALENKVLDNRVSGVLGRNYTAVDEGHDSAAIKELNTFDVKAKALFKVYLERASYDVDITSLVQKFIVSYDQWISTERKVFKHFQHVDEDSYHRLELLNEADGRLLHTLDVLGEAEAPIHETIRNGRKATRFVQIIGATLILYLFFIVLILQREASRKIASREEDLKITLSSIGDAVISTDVKGMVTRMNPVAEQLTGWTLDEAKGLPLTDIFTIENASTGETVKNPVEEVLQHGKIVGLANHTVLVSRDGNLYQIADSAAPIRNRENVIRGVVLVFHDVTNAYETQQKVHDQVIRLRDIFSASMDAIIAADENGTIVEWNAQAEIIFGWKRDEILGDYLHETIIPLAYRNRHLEGIERLKKTGQATMLGQRIEITALKKNGEEFPIELSISQLDRNEGLLFSAFVRDLTEIKAARQELKLAATTFESHSGIMITDGEKNILRVNSALEKMSGYNADELIGKNPRMLRSDLQDNAFYKKMWLKIKTTGGWQGELWNSKKDGSLYAEDLTITAVKDKIGNVTHYVGTSNDITERKRAEEKIEQLAYYDELTNLANRRLLLNRLHYEILVATRHQTFGSLLYLDLDRFKNLNDALGHPVGDELLRQVATRLKELVRGGDTVSRLGGDEFVIMLPVMNEDVERATIEASAVAEKARMRLGEVFDLEGYQYHLNTSIGIVIFPEEDDTPDNILKHADSALYLAKAEGRNTSRFYEVTLQEDADARLALEKDIRSAMRNNELLLNYQPQVDINGNIVGIEALLRWHHPQHGIIPPDKFIPLAEETGLILDIGNWVLKTAVEHVAQWNRLGVCPDHKALAVNVSPRQFNQADFVQQVKHIIEDAGVAPGCIELEITENLLMGSVGAVIEKLSELREYGVRIAIDDFGTGYSSLSYLKTLPLDKLKIDQSFVRDLAVDSNDAAIVDTIIAMSSRLNLQVIAEGVETREQLDFLKAKGCEVFQGYYFSKPVSAEQILIILQENCLSPE